MINAAGYVRVDDAEDDPERCERENTRGAGLLALACARRGLPLVTFSSDLVFDGCSTQPYVEGDLVRPLSVYGLSKARAEAAVLRAYPEALVVRTSAFFGPWDEHNFVTGTLRALLRGATVHAADDVVVSPTYVPDLVNASLDLLIDRADGLWHLTNQGSTTWLELARMAADATGVPAARLQGTTHRRVGWRARRPLYSAMSSARGLLLPDIGHALERYAAASRDRLEAAA